MAMTYTFKVIKTFTISDESGKEKTFEEGDIFDMFLKVSEYDPFKAAYPEVERYFDDGIGFTHGRTRRLDGQFGARMKQIQQTYPGARKMFDNAEFQPWKEH